MARAKASYPSRALEQLDRNRCVPLMLDARVPSCNPVVQSAVQ